MSDTPTQTWMREDGYFMARRKTERNDEIARLHWVEEVSLRDLAYRYQVTPTRIVQIVGHKRYKHLWLEP